MDKRTENVIEVVRLKPGDLIDWDKLYHRWDREVYDLLSSLIFFNNQYCEENKIDLDRHYLNYDFKEESFSPRATSVCKIAKIATFQDLVNYPSTELIKIRLCGPKTIQEFKDYIINAFQVWNYVFIPGLPEANAPRIINIKRFYEFKKKQRQDIEDHFRK
ncbi:MAG: hypothetical protein K9N09_09130 [Candidatus Cloacimonetes bacterium]|nr:hypothetical protein [Candidatus Cloacimonadota bacterium]MCF7814201.1 hypothetical protein [Candidatus Cloacimonadota bacterium]MCF7868850.1 hypothetical protein [Candidatus Cloacimonadota bacterium]MCF7884257.1 hypothetical protein [Candidatus Cloacimonadota bacterium]